MKKSVILSGIIVAVTLCLCCCSKSEETNTSTKSNQLKIGDNSYELFSASLANYGADTWFDGYNFDLTLSANGPSDPAALTMAIGVYFALFSPDATDLAEGTYQYSDADRPSALTFNEGVAGAYKLPEAVRIIRGTVIVKKSGVIYTITFDCTDSSGAQVTGYYKGELRSENNPG